MANLLSYRHCAPVLSEISAVVRLTIKSLPSVSTLLSGVSGF
jgi:hypothetical protein